LGEQGDLAVKKKQALSVSEKTAPYSSRAKRKVKSPHLNALTAIIKMAEAIPESEAAKIRPDLSDKSTWYL
jgi:hypothetical protein